MDTHLSAYHVLGVKRDSKDREIKKKYLAIASKNHPDKSGEETVETFHNAKWAYDQISTEEKRREYDTLLYENERRRTQINPAEWNPFSLLAMSPFHAASISGLGLFGPGLHDHATLKEASRDGTLRVETKEINERGKIRRWKAVYHKGNRVDSQESESIEDSYEEVPKDERQSRLRLKDDYERQHEDSQFPRPRTREGHSGSHREKANGYGDLWRRRFSTF